MVETSVVTTKGRIVIPARIRRRRGIKHGTRVCFIDRGEEIALRPLTAEYFQKGTGMLGTGGKVLKVFLEEQKLER